MERSAPLRGRLLLPKAVRRRLAHLVAQPDQAFGNDVHGWLDLNSTDRWHPSRPAAHRLSHASDALAASAARVDRAWHCRRLGRRTVGRGLVDPDHRPSDYGTPGVSLWRHLDYRFGRGARHTHPEETSGRRITIQCSPPGAAADHVVAAAVTILVAVQAR